MKRNFIEETKQKIETNFPIVIQGIIYYLYDEIEVIRKGTNRYRYLVPLIDNEGYKYKIDHNTLHNAKSNNSLPARFFKNNPFTYENINNYCRINKIDLCIDGTGLPIKGYARETLNFIDSSGNIVKIDWNSIQQKQTDGNDITVIKNKVILNKEEATKIIKEMAMHYDRPLIQSDFENVTTSHNSVGIRVIWRIWGTFTNMINDLELESHDTYFKPNSENYKPHEDIMAIIENTCRDVLKLRRNTVMVDDFKKYGINSMSTIHRHCNLDNVSIHDVLSKYGCKLQSAGNGMNHLFEDGEKVVSRYEYDFSSYLRKNGFVFGKSYFRDVYYKDLDGEYNGTMTCDYKIIFNDKIVYIELAGILGNKKHQEAYINNIVIKSKSKEEYRQKLNRKREMFERNGLEYYILLPFEMNEEKYNEILMKYQGEVEICT